MATEATRPYSTILREVTEQRGKHAKLGRKLRANRDRNWLLALILNAYAKKAEGKELGELDQIIVDAFTKEGLDSDMQEHGRLYAGMSAATRKELFPGEFGTMAVGADYSAADLSRDLPALDRAVRAMPNAVDIDVQGIHEGRVARGDVRRASKAVAAEHAGEFLRAVEPDLPSKGNRALPTDPFRIKATTFHCTDETGTDWLGSDEPYWIFGSVGLGVSVTSRSHVFGDIDSGDNATFSATEGWLWGHDGTPQPLPDGEIGALIQLWEHDGGDPDKVKASVGAAFAVAAGVLTISGVAAWVGAVVAGVGAAVQWLLGYLDDDHIGDQTFVFTRQTLLDQASKVGSTVNMTRRFTDGDGDYSATIAITHMAPPAGTGGHVVIGGTQVGQINTHGQLEVTKG